MKLLKLSSLIFIFVLLSCGSDNNTVIDEPDKPEPVQPVNKYPTELVGTWQFYSGNPVGILSSIEEKDILNQTFIFVANGNMNEAIVHPNTNYQGETSSANGNWFVENKQLKLTDWQGNAISSNCSYKINADSSLTLTISGKSAVYYKQEDIKKKYSDLIIGSWNNMRDGSARERMSFYNTGRGYSQSYFINGFYYGGEPFSWTYNDNVITVIYDNIAGSMGHHEYVLNYLNNNSISWTYKNEAKFYVREQQ